MDIQQKFGDSYCVLKRKDGSILPEIHQYRFRKSILNLDTIKQERNKSANDKDIYVFISTQPLINIDNGNVEEKISNNSKITDKEERMILHRLLPKNTVFVYSKNCIDYFGPYANRMFMFSKKLEIKEDSKL